MVASNSWVEASPLRWPPAGRVRDVLRVARHIEPTTRGTRSGSCRTSGRSPSGPVRGACDDAHDRHVSCARPGAARVRGGRLPDRAAPCSGAVSRRTSSSSASAAAYGSVSPATTAAARSSSSVRPCTSPQRSRSAVTAIASISSRARRVRRARELAGRLQPGAVLVDRRDHLVDALARSARRSCTIGGRQAPSGRSAEREHRAQVAADLVGAVAVGLVDDVHVADLEDAGLRRLDAVAHARARAAPAWCRRAPAISTSLWPTPTVSTRTTSQPAASSTRSACGVAQDSPPRWPREAIERM